ncbi:MAG: hypothetical protein LC797_21530 [Chloroflexi bacterium]|nr:hypothetical protein [Chloroflexota bacterium]
MNEITRWALELAQDCPLLVNNAVAQAGTREATREWRLGTCQAHIQSALSRVECPNAGKADHSSSWIENVQPLTGFELTQLVRGQADQAPVGQTTRIMRGCFKAHGKPERPFLCGLRFSLDGRAQR